MSVPLSSINEAEKRVNQLILGEYMLKNVENQKHSEFNTCGTMVTAL